MKLTKMVPISSIQLLLLTMVMLLALPDCDASIGIKKVVVQAGDEVMVPGIRYMNDAKEMLTITKAAEGTTRGKLGGRKMMTEGKEVISNEAKKEESKKISTTTTVEASKIISGTRDIGKYSKKSPEDTLMNMDDQNDTSPETSVKRPVDLHNSDQICSHKCSNGSVSKKSDPNSFQKLDTEKLMKAASRIVNLMNKDYDGNNIPGHRTPINNHEPLH